MPAISFNSVLIIAAIAVLVPVAAGLLPAALFPAGAQRMLVRATPVRSAPLPDLLPRAGSIGECGHTAKDSSSARAGRSTVTPGEEAGCFSGPERMGTGDPPPRDRGASVIAISATGRG